MIVPTLCVGTINQAADRASISKGARLRFSGIQNQKIAAFGSSYDSV